MASRSGRVLAPAERRRFGARPLSLKTSRWIALGEAPRVCPSIGTSRVLVHAHLRSEWQVLQRSHYTSEGPPGQQSHTRNLSRWPRTRPLSPSQVPRSRCSSEKRGAPASGDDGRQYRYVGMGRRRQSSDQESLICSDQLRSILGWRDSDISLGRFARIVHHRDRRRLRAALRDSSKNHSNYDVEFRITRPDGSHRWIVAKGRAEYAGELPVRVFGVALDITERKLGTCNPAA